MGRGDIGRDNTSRLGERSLAVSATVALDGGLKDAATAPCRRCESSRGEAGRGEAGRGDAGAAEARKGRGDDGSRRGDGAWPRGDSACTWSSVFEPLGIGEIIMEPPLGRTVVLVLVLVLVPLLVGLLLAGAGAAGAAKGSPLPLNKCHSGRRWLELGSRMRARSSFVITGGLDAAGGSAAPRGRAVSGGPQRGQSSDTARGVGAISSFDTHIGDAMHAGLSCRAHGEHSKSSVHVTAPLRSFRELVYEGWGLILSRQTSRGTQDTTHGTQRQHDGRRDPHTVEYQT